MHDTEEVTLLSDGPQIAAKTLEPIGIMHGSEAWGLWVPDECEQGHEQHIPHLLVSAIPPASWPLAFQLQAYVSDGNSSLLRLTRALKDSQVDIIFAECGPAGHHHAALNAVCVARGLEAALETVLTTGGRQQSASQPMSRQELRDRIYASDEKERRLAFRRLGVLMLMFLARLESYLFDKHQSESDFLYALGVDEGGGQLRKRFTRKRAPWELSPRYILKEDPGPVAGVSSGRHRDAPHEGLLDCINQENVTGFPGPVEWKGQAEQLMAQTGWWEQDPPLRDAAAAAPPGISDAVALLEALKSTDPSHPFRFYRAWRNHTFDVIRLRALERLSYFWLNSDHRPAPMAFEYDERQQVLRALNGRDFSNSVTGLVGGGVTLPARSVVSIDRAERFLRFCVFEQRQVERNLVLIDLPYTAKKSQVASDPVSTSGLLHDLVSVVEEAASGSSLRRVSNRLTEQSDAREQGRVRIVLDVAPNDPGTDPATLPAAATRIRKAIEAFGQGPHERCEIELGEDVKVVRYPARSVFVSMVQDFPRRSDVVAFLMSLCQERGLEAIIVGDDPGLPSPAGLYQSAITDQILRSIRESDGFLQLLTLRTAEREALRRKEAVRPNYGWLAYEYGIADERGLGPIRVVDACMPPDVRAAFGVRRDNPELDFDTDACDDHLRDQLRYAVEKVEEWLYRRPPRSAVIK